MRIALDVHGGDFGVRPNIEGALAAAAGLRHEVILVGREAEIREDLRARGISGLPAGISIVNAEQTVAMDGEPVEECRKKPDSSLMVAAGLAGSGKADVFISAGNSGAVMVAALFKMKRIPGVIRPAIAALLPNKGRGTLLIDAGSNMDCRPWHLAQFAVMGSVYMEMLLKIKKPRVGIFSIGEEECKGNALVQKTVPLIKKVGVNFVGPMEGRDLPEDRADVIVADGFVGNVALKLYEGTAKMVFGILKENIMSRFTYKMGALLMKPLFATLKSKMNADTYGGAPLLGINGVALVCHGRSNATAIYNAIRVGGELASMGLASEIGRRMEEVKTHIDEAQKEEE